MGYAERIEELEKEIKKTQYNKATQHHIGLLKARIAALREKIEKASSGGKKGEGYAVRKTGDATIIMLGYPSVGKSTLLNSLTNADSEVADYEFTTLEAIPGMLEINGARIQIVDVPGIVSGAASGRGRGKEVLSVLRNADLCIMVVDIHKPRNINVLRQEVYDSGIRLNQILPDVKIKKKEKGGVSLGTTCKLTKTDKETIKDVTKALGYMNADVVVRENITIDQYIDVFEANKSYMPSITILNKADLVKKTETQKMIKRIKGDISISAKKKENLEELKELIWTKLGLIRIFMKEPTKKADIEEPLIIKKGSTIEDVCDKLHKDMKKRFKFARISGPSAKFEGQKVSLNHKMQDEDILELHLR